MSEKQQQQQQLQEKSFIYLSKVCTNTKMDIVKGYFQIGMAKGKKIT